MIRDVSIVLRGTVAAQVIGFLALPLLSRLFSPAAFGHYSIYQAAIMVVSVAACLRYDMAILTAADEAEAIGLFRLSVLTGAAVSSLALLVLGALELADSSFSRWLGFSALWFGPATLLSGVLLAATALLTRLAQFRLSARTKLGQAIGAAGSSLACSQVLASPTGLVLGDLVGRATGVALFAGQLGRSLGAGWWRGDGTPLRLLARRFDSFPRYSVLGGLLNNGASFLAPAAILTVYGATTAGQFSLVDRAISLPVGMIVVTLSQVFSSHFARVLRDAPASALSYFRRVFGAAAALGAIPAIVGALVAPFLFALVFGAQWEMAGHYARILALMYFTALAFGPVSNGLVILNRLRQQFGWEAVRLVLLVGVWGSVAHLRPAPEVALAWWGGVTILVNLAYVALVDVAIRRRVTTTELAENM